MQGCFCASDDLPHAIEGQRGGERVPLCLRLTRLRALCFGLFLDRRVTLVSESRTSTEWLAWTTSRATKPTEETRTSSSRSSSRFPFLLSHPPCPICFLGGMAADPRCGQVFNLPRKSWKCPTGWEGLDDQRFKQYKVCVCVGALQKVQREPALRGTKCACASKSTALSSVYVYIS
jgi:hypothetical protein